MSVQLQIPDTVVQAIRLPEERIVREAIEARWLRVEEVKDQALAQVLQRDLDKGEAEAIAGLADEGRTGAIGRAGRA